MWKNNPLPSSDVWFHVCSLGEATSLEPLIDHLSPATIVVSTTTQTGFDRARKLVHAARFLPYEVWLPFWVRRHKVAVVLEAELWWMLFFSAQKMGAKTVLLNARITQKKFHTYKKMRWFYRALFKHVDKVFCQSSEDKVRLEYLGAKDVTVIGNIKLAKEIVAHHKLVKPNKEMVIAASTHEHEEKLIMESMSYASNRVLAVVPRHPERFEAVHAHMVAFSKAHDLSYHRYSQQNDFESDIVLVDMLGLLIDVYAISDVVILGGSFEPIGGHNPLEPAAFGNKIISGPHYFNQTALFPLVKNLHVIESTQLKECLTQTHTLLPASIEGSVDMQPFYDYIQTHIKG